MILLLFMLLKVSIIIVHLLMKNLSISLGLLLLCLFIHAPLQAKMDKSLLDKTEQVITKQNNRFQRWKQKIVKKQWIKKFRSVKAKVLNGLKLILIGAVVVAPGHQFFLEDY